MMTDRESRDQPAVSTGQPVIGVLRRPDEIMLDLDSPETITQALRLTMQHASGKASTREIRRPGGRGRNAESEFHRRQRLDRERVASAPRPGYDRSAACEHPRPRGRSSVVGSETRRGQCSPFLLSDADSGGKGILAPRDSSSFRDSPSHIILIGTIHRFENCPNTHMP